MNRPNIFPTFHYISYGTMFRTGRKYIIITTTAFLLFIYALTLLRMRGENCPSISLTRRTVNTSSLMFQDTIGKDDLTIWCLEMEYRLNFENHSFISQLVVYGPRNNNGLYRFPYRYLHWKSSSILPRALSQCEHSILMRLLMTIDRICRNEKIIYMMSHGTLLGSWRHHDIIPWDDDADLIISMDGKSRFLTALSLHNESLLQYSTYLVRGQTERFYKIYFRNTPRAGQYSWGFPSVDIFFFTQNKTHIVPETHRVLTMELKHVFPLKMRPFGQLWLPAPKKPQYIFSYTINNECLREDWSHRNETSQEVITIECTKLKDVYPFVYRKDLKSEIEIMKINGSTIHTVVYS